MAKLKDGFYKQTAEAIGSDLYVLLAGGGSKALSDFATSSGVVTALGTNGNYVTWTKNGIANNLTVPYASKASLLEKQGGTSTAQAVWNPKTSWTKVWGQAFTDTAITSDTGDILYYLRPGIYGSNSTELCVTIDGDYYAGLGSYKVLHEGNYNSYAPTLTGGGASGTWGINISGNASTSTEASKLTRAAYLESDEAIDGFLEANKFKFAQFKTSAANSLGMASNDGMLLSIPWGSTTYGFQLAFDDTTSVVMKGRGKSSSWGSWVTFYHTGNLSKSTLGLGNVQDTAFYKRQATVNGTTWDLAGTVNSLATFTIYAPTTAGTSGQVLTSSGGTPSWTDQSSLSVGSAKYLISVSPTTGAKFWYYMGQPTLSDTYEGSNADYSKYSYPKEGTYASSSNVNIQNLRLQWSSSYFHDIFASPNARYLWHRDVQNGSAKAWSRIVEEDCTDYSRTWNITASNADKLDGYHASSFMHFTHDGNNYVNASFLDDNLKTVASTYYIEFWDGTGGWFNSQWGKVTAVTGFYKSGSSNSYVLLGGGGHKALSTLQSEYDVRYVNVTGDSMSGGLTINASNAGVPLILKGGLNDYREGLRIMPYDGWSDILLAGTDAAEASGTSANSWFIGNNDGSFYINKNNSSNSTGVELCNIAGNWGVGKVSPSYKLDVASNARVASIIMEITDEINRYGGNLYLQHRGTVAGSQGDARTSNVIMCANGGNVLVGTASNPGYRLNVGGSAAATVMYANSGFYESSDERLKKILNPVKVNLDELSKLRKIYYLWKDNSRGSRQLGMIAQDVQRLYPELVDVDKETGLLSLAYDRLSVIALEAIDTLYQDYKKLKERVDKLEELLTNKGIS